MWHQANRKATLTEIEEMIDQELAQVRKRLVSIAFEEDEEDAEVSCPECNRVMGNNGRKERRLQIKGGETVKYERRQKRCHTCGMTIFPPR